MKKAVGIFFKLLALILSVIVCLMLILGIFYGIKGYQMYQQAKEKQPMEEMVGKIQGQEHFVSFEELPSIYVDAVVSTEDRRFWSHGGIDIIAIGRAAWNDIKTFSFAEGGSTITQQLAKNLYFTQEKELERKFAEIFAAFAFESKYSKEEIFELYVNTIYFGSGYYGIYDAALGYYGKKPSELTDYEAVMLAGLPNAPTAYALDTNPELAEQRMRQVLARMEECGKISGREADKLLQVQ